MLKIFSRAAVALLCATSLLFCTKGKEFNEAGFLVPLTVDQDPALPSITVNDAQLHAEAFGPPDSALLIVLHGGPGSDYRYLLNCKAFAQQGFRVVFYDQRGSGLSQRFPAETYQSIQVMYDELSGVIAHYRTSPTQKVFLLGHSWGGMLATGYINTYPDAIDGVIVGEPGGLKWADIEAYFSRLFDYKFTGEALNDVTYQDQFLTGKADQHAILDYKFALLAGAEETEESPVGNEGPLPYWRAGAVINDTYLAYGERIKVDFTTHLNDFKKPVLFLYSEHNKAYGKAHAELVSSAFNEVELFLTKGAGHDMLSFPTGWNNSFPVMLNYLNRLK
jgi:proline iminopeptidase